ncbi:cytochrome P450 2F2-like [Styela clava]
MLNFVITLLIVSIIGLFMNWYRRDHRLPPGPRGIPFLGVVPFLGKHPAKAITEWSKKYGKAYTARFGNKDLVILTDYEHIYDVNIRQSSKLGSRPPAHVFNATNQGRGIVFADLDVVEIHRPFTLQALKRLGMGKSSMANRIHEETSYLIQAIREKGGKPFDPKDLFLYAAMNIACLNVAGERYSYDDDTLKKMASKLVDGLRDNGIYIFLSNVCGYLASIPPFKSAIETYVNDFNQVKDTFGRKIKEHENTYDKNDLRDYIDIFLEEMKKEDHHPTFNKNQLKVTLHNLLDGGSQTLSCTLSWCMLALLHYPESYKKLKEEVDDVLDCSEKITMSDRKNMNYTQAFIHELTRRCTLIKVFDSCSITDEVEVDGYKLPKNTGIFSISWAVHNDPSCFSDPDDFNPDRFINPEDGTFQKSQNTGCHSRLENEIAWKFEISVETGTEIPSLDGGHEGALYTPLPIKLIMTERE